jgi:hypothetical protein
MDAAAVQGPVPGMHLGLAGGCADREIPTAAGKTHDGLAIADCLDEPAAVRINNCVCHAGTMSRHNLPSLSSQLVRLILDSTPKS